MSINVINDVGYGLTEALPKIFKAPIVALRAPLTTDFGPIGLLWIDKSASTAYILVNVANNTATWNLLESSGGTGVFASVASTTFVTAGTSMSAATTITAGTGITATTGNVTISDGDLVLSTAGTYVSLPGPVFIYSGSGAPASGLALHIGDMYINTTAASATTRAYMATAVGTWTNFTMAG